MHVLTDALRSVHRSYITRTPRTEALVSVVSGIVVTRVTLPRCTAHFAETLFSYNTKTHTRRHTSTKYNLRFVFVS
jgi:hypothetical protein